MRVKVIAKGFDGMAMRFPGEIITVEAEGFSAKWMEKIEEKEKPAAKAAAKPAPVAAAKPAAAPQKPAAAAAKPTGAQTVI